jgi:hypothetical protein
MSRQRKQAALSCEEQIRRWVAGESIHNTTRDECCPDFSCCNPSILTPLELRKAFLEGDGQQRNRMLAGFLGGLLRSRGLKVLR